MHTCSWFSSNEHPECGQPAPHLVTVTTPLYRATMWFCTDHKLAQEANFARRVPGQRRSVAAKTSASTST
ncbi:hypothetical protein [Sporichthya sp.]|uniref:hypothetical protein n=1 Tax=Sporichthya sp. TaxID=65475 RepID=UPI00184A4A9F|nr:hypothetical protein [Sporichthya sp.]MBA3745078.1 hypothetical protein [Sporichthya sp.]